jgi:hypothetical protein
MTKEIRSKNDDGESIAPPATVEITTAASLPVVPCHEENASPARTFAVCSCPLQPFNALAVRSFPQLRKGAWLPRSFTLSTNNSQPFRPMAKISFLRRCPFTTIPVARYARNQRQIDHGRQPALTM